MLLGALTLGAFMRVGQADPLSSIGGPQSFYEPVLLGVVLAALVPLAASASTWSLAARAPIWMALAYSLWAMLSFGWSLEPLLTFGKSFELFVTLVICLLFVVAVKEAGLSHRFYDVVAWAAFLVIAAFLIGNVLLYGTPLYMHGDLGVPDRQRLWLIYTHPLVSGDLAGLGLLACVVGAMRKRWKLLQIGLFGSVLLLTNSRAGIIAAALALLVWLVTRTKSGEASPRRTLMLATLLSAASAGAVLLVVNNDELLRLLPVDVLSLDGRVGLWQRVLDFAFADPIHALAGYGYFASRFLLLDVYAWAGHAHQTILEVLLTTGIVGTVLVFSFMVSTSLVSLRSTAILSVWTYVLITSFDNPTLFAPTAPMVIMMWTLANAVGAEVRSSVGFPETQSGEVPLSRRFRSADALALERRTAWHRPRAPQRRRRLDQGAQPPGT